MDEKKEQFSDFPPVSTETWEKKIEADLKGVDYHNKLITRTLENIDIRPYYREDTISTKPWPGEHVSAIKGDDIGWKIRQDAEPGNIPEGSLKALCQKAVDGVDVICHEGNKDAAGSVIGEAVELFDEVNVKGGICAVEHVGALMEKAGKCRISIDYNPLKRLCLTGGFYNSEEEDFDLAAELFQKTAIVDKKYLTEADGEFFHNAGADRVQEIAFTLSSAAEYISAMDERGINPQDSSLMINFLFASGTDYFMEIAKFRAARVLRDTLLNAWGVDAGKSPMSLQANTSWRMMTCYDKHTNLLRTTTAALSAILGGADSVLVRPFDIATCQPNPFSRRLARNIQLILREEAMAGKTSDPTAGSWYIEELTQSLITKAWALFQQVEERGGFIQAMKDGFIQKQLKESAIKRILRARSGKDIITGVNHYPDRDERIAEQGKPLELYHFENCENQVSEPITAFRDSEKIEAFRMAIEESEKIPRVFLLAFGNPTMRRAREEFATNFFSTGGFQVIANDANAALDAEIVKAIESGAEIIVACSSDDEYEGAIPVIKKSLSGQCLVIAGKAGEARKKLEESGIRHFIHKDMDIIEKLNEILEETGINQKA